MVDSPRRNGRVDFEFYLEVGKIQRRFANSAFLPSSNLYFVLGMCIFLPPLLTLKPDSSSGRLYEPVIVYVGGGAVIETNSLEEG